jgi:hypothetical protein
MEATVFACSTIGVSTLDAAAKSVFELLGLEAIEERESSNYVDGHYFLGHAANASVQVCLSDGSTMPEYPFWISIEPLAPWVKGVSHTMDPSVSAIAALLAKHGWRIFVPLGPWGRKDWDGKGTVYAA